MGAYVQEDMQVRPNLTINLGLRWEMATVPTEVNGKLANYPDPSTNLASEPHIGAPWFEGGKKDLGPRVGFAWDPFPMARPPSGAVLVSISITWLPSRIIGSWPLPGRSPSLPRLATFRRVE